MGKSKQHKKRRCTVCRTLISEHVGPYGPGKCTENDIDSPASSQTEVVTPDMQHGHNLPRHASAGSTPVASLHLANETAPHVNSLPCAPQLGVPAPTQPPHNKATQVTATSATIQQPIPYAVNGNGNPFISMDTPAPATTDLQSTLNVLVTAMANMQTQLTSIQSANQQRSNFSGFQHQASNIIQGPAAAATFSQGDIMPNLGGPVAGLRSATGLSDMSSLFTIPGTPEKSIRQSLQGEYACLDEFLQNYSLNNSEAQDLQSYMASDGNIAYRNKRQRRRITSLSTWLEAWHNYERLLLSYHGFHLYLQNRTLFICSLCYEL